MRVHRIQLRGRMRHNFLETLFSLWKITSFRDAVCKWDGHISKVATSSSVASSLGEVMR